MTEREGMKPKPIDASLIAQTMALRKQGKTQEEIAVALGVVQSTISVILRRNNLGGHLVQGRKVRGRRA